MQYIGYLMFVIGAAGVDSSNVAVPVVMVLSGLAILEVSVWKERRKEQYGKTSINGKRHCGNLQRIRKYGLQNNKTA